MKERLGFIGAGTIATAFAVKLAEGGYPVVAVSNVKSERAKRMADRIPGCRVQETNQGVVDAADFVIIATQDQFMSSVINEINWHPDRSVVHTSGLFGTEILEPARRTGARVGGLHPCGLFPDLEQALKVLPGATFGIMGESPVLDILKNIVATLQGNYIVLKSEDKPLYHVALTFASDFPMVCIKIATELFGKLGVPQDKALKMLAPVVRGTVDGVINLGFPDCFSCAVTRGDLNVIAKHVAALEEKEPGLAGLFKEMDLHIVEQALAKGAIDETLAGKERAVLKK